MGNWTLYTNFVSGLRYHRLLRFFFPQRVDCVFGKKNCFFVRWFTTVRGEKKKTTESFG